MRKLSRPRGRQLEGRDRADLDERLGRYDRVSLAAKIVDPYRDLPSEAFAAMPEDFGERMSAAELDALVAFLLAPEAPP